ncbi:hypothetical protein EYF80_045987 [Liparis tanakae]|uniref:Secreted protein n=1 Tax=Liparis tanakae TaxID=230148 RepID=A0A4Z2FS41_9TELE|nr:hypothetical protein EYF80_045987 [Liparis tanakae]
MWSASCWVQVLIRFWASMWVMSSVLPPLMARMVSPGRRSPRAALPPGVTCRRRAEGEGVTPRGRDTKTYQNLRRRFRTRDAFCGTIVPGNTSGASDNHDQEEEEASRRRPSALGVTHRDKHVSPAASVCGAEAKRRNEGRRLRV